VLKKETLPVLHRQPGALEALLPFGGLAGVSRVFYSPAGIFDFEAREGAHWNSAGALRAAGVGAGDVVLNTFSHHLTPAARLADEGAIALGASVVPAGPGQIPVQLDLMRRLGVTVYIGLPSFLGMLIDAAGEHGIDWKRDLRVRKAVVGAEPIAASARRRFEQDYGIEVYTIYGTADAGMIGFECERHDGWHVDEAAFRASDRLIEDLRRWD
jgi:phenylacetate-CoA ligase